MGYIHKESNTSERLTLSFSCKTHVLVFRKWTLKYLGMKRRFTSQFQMVLGTMRQNLNNL